MYECGSGGIGRVSSGGMVLWMNGAQEEPAQSYGRFFLTDGGGGFFGRIRVMFFNERSGKCGRQGMSVGCLAGF